MPVKAAACLLALLLVNCSSPPPKAVEEPAQSDPTKEPWYGQTVAELAQLNQQAEGLLRRRKTQAAGELVAKGQPLMSRLLAVLRPTLAAVEASSDLDDLYGRLLFANRQYGWARLQFQKNVARWKTWAPQTAESARRRKIAEQRIAECDERIARGG